MHYVKTTNYDKFKCIADKCPETCCAGWQIVIDDESLKKYANMRGPFSGRLLNEVNFSEGCFKQYGKRCAMLNDDNLCDLITECGEDALCYTCAMYPRHVEEYEGVREYSLSLSCPEAARMILENKEKLEFIEWDDDEEDDFEDFDYLIYTKLEDARDVIYKIIQDRSLSFYRKADILTAFGLKLQEKIDNDEIFDMDDVIDEFAGDVTTLPGDDLWKKNEHITLLNKLEVLYGDWQGYIGKAYEMNEEPVLTEEEEIQAEQLLMFFFYVYFCGAVYDDMIKSKVLMSVMSVYWIFKIDRAMEKPDIIKTAYLYAREVEHSDLNLDDLEDMLKDL
ncbi:MAG: flagellin lysine-N-methylase [Lachnospiraceae bacterium]|nr:flagellin lysine-N-methylase [Lachnospiraceae bacterium]